MFGFGSAGSGDDDLRGDSGAQAEFETFDHAGDQRQRQSNNIEIAAVDAGNPAGSLALDSVRSGFAPRLARGDVGSELVVGGCEHRDPGDFGGDFCDGVGWPGGEEGDACDDLVGGAGEETEHAGRVGVVFGLGEDCAVGGDDGGVGAEDHGRFSLGLSEGFEGW